MQGIKNSSYYELSLDNFGINLDEGQKCSEISLKNIAFMQIISVRFHRKFPLKQVENTNYSWNQYHQVSVLYSLK